MKKILVRIESIEPNHEEYHDEVFLDVNWGGKDGDEIIVERQDYYPFKEGMMDGYGIMPNKILFNKKGERSEKSLGYVRLTQIRLIDK